MAHTTDSKADRKPPIAFTNGVELGSDHHPVEDSAKPSTPVFDHPAPECHFINSQAISALFLLRNSDPRLSLSAFAVGVALASFMNSDGICWPSRAAIASRTGIETRNISRGLRELKRRGFITITQKNGTSSTYLLVNPNFLVERKDRVHDDQETPAVSPGAPIGGVKYTNPTPVRFTTPSPGKSDRGGCQIYQGGVGKSDTRKEPKKEPKKEEYQDVPVEVEAAISPMAAIPPELEGLDLYLRDLPLLKAWPSLMKSWGRAFPEIDIAHEVTRAHTWELNNPDKKPGNRGDFLTRWLDRAKPSLANAAARKAEEEFQRASMAYNDGGLEEQILIAAS